MSVLRRLTLIQAISLCVCATIAFKANTTLLDSVHSGFVEQTTFGSVEYILLPSGAVQLAPINSSYRHLSSGPILIVDETTLYITSLRYDGKLPNVHFVAKNRVTGLNFVVPDENGSINNLNAYWGRNIYLKLPNNATISDIDHVFVRSASEDRNYGTIFIPHGIDVPKNANQEDGGRKVIWLPKCCSIEKSITLEGCQEGEQQFCPLTEFLEMNSTHINNESLSQDCALYQPYVNPLKCKDGKIPLYEDMDTFLYLQNGSLLYIDGKMLLAQDQFCVEVIKDQETTVPFICLPPRGYPEILYYVYATGMLLSSVFFVLTAAVFYFVFEDCKVRIRCIILYSLCMAGSFIILSIAQLSHVEGETCNALGYILELFFALSFAWLAFLSYETQYIISKPPTKRYQARFKIYCGVAVTIATVLVVLTVAMSEIPFLPQQILKPQFGHNSCVFDEKTYKTLFFYIPIFIGIFVSIGCLIYAKYLIIQKSKVEEENNRITQHDLKNKFRACWMLVTIGTVCWIMEVVSFALNSQSGIIIAMDIVECLQGLFVFIIFVLHNPVKDKVLSKLCPSRSQRTTNGNLLDSFIDRIKRMEELRPLNAQQSQSNREGQTQITELQA